MTAVQLLGVNRASWFIRVCFIVGIVIPSLAMLTLAIVYLAKGNPSEVTFNGQNVLHSLFQSDSLVKLVPYMLAFMGIEASASYASNLKNPKVQYPIAIILLVIFAIILDSLGGIAVAVTVPLSELSLNSGVLQAIEVMLKVNLPQFSWLLSVFALLLSFCVQNV